MPVFPFRMNLPDDFETIVGKAAYTAMTRGGRVNNPGNRTTLMDLGVDSLHAAGVCAALQGLLKDAGVEVSRDIVDSAVQLAFADTNSTVGAAVSAVRRNVLSELSLKERRESKINAV